MLSKRLLYININHRCNPLRRCYASFKSSKENEEPFDPDRPIRFSTSPAAHFNLRQLRLKPDPIMDAPWYKVFILWGTLFASVIYLMFYRQRTHVDDELEMPLGKRFLQIKEELVMREKNAAIRNGQSTKIFDEELQEIYNLRKKYKYDEDD